MQPSGELGVFADEGDYVAESLAGGWGWVAGKFEDGQSALSFCSASSSRYSFAALSARLLDANLLFYGCRHGGSEERNACLLR